MTTRVVNIHLTGIWDVYIGRRNNRLGQPDSIWANPFVIGPDGTRAEVIEKYRANLMRHHDLLARLPELRGKVLGCWCAPTREGLTASDPLVCHGQVLAEMADALEVTTP